MPNRSQTVFQGGAPSHQRWRRQAAARERRPSDGTGWVCGLLRELDALAASPSLQRAHALHVLRDLMNARLAVVTYYQGGQLVSYEHTYLEPRILYLVESTYVGRSDARDLSIERVLALRGVLVTVPESRLMGQQEWLEARYTQEITKPAQLGLRLYSKRVVAPGVVERLTIVRAWGDLDFTEEDVEVLRLFHRHYRFTPISIQEQVATLPAREARVLARILDGASEKLIASELGVSQSLIRKTTTSIYRYFGVSSRSELCGLHLSMQRPESVAGPELSFEPLEALQGLTARQREVCAALATGASEAEAARLLDMSYHTLHEHVKGVYRKLGISSRGELMALLGRERGRAS